MRECEHSQRELVDLFDDDLSPDRRGRLVARVRGCEACAAELRRLEGAWNELPERPPRRAPADAKAALLAYARQTAGERRSLAATLWRVTRPALLPAGAGAAASAAVLSVLRLGGRLDGGPHLPVAALGLALAILFAGVFGGLRRGASRPATRGILLGGLGAFGGYLILSSLHPIPSAVEFCQLRLLRDPAMSLGQICLIYAAVAALYAGLPVGAMAYLSAEDGVRWKLGLAEAAVFTLLALPISVLEFGLQDTVITLTVLGGLAAGAAGGGLTGGLARGILRAGRAGA